MPWVPRALQQLEQTSKSDTSERCIFDRKTHWETTIDGNSFAKKTDDRFDVSTPYPIFNVDCDALFTKSLLVVSAKMLSRMFFYGAVLNIKIGGVGDKRVV